MVYRISQPFQVVDIRGILSQNDQLTALVL